MSYHGKVYDVSNWEEHPGGSVIFTHAGDDATDIMAAFHPPNVSDFLDRFYVGDLDETVFPKGFYANKKDPKEQKAFEKGYMIRTTGDIIALSPPLIITREQIDELIGTVGDVLKSL